MLHRYLCLSHHPFLSLSLLCLFVSLPGDSSNWGRVKEKGRKGCKTGTQGLFFLLGQTNRDYGPKSAQVLFICQLSFICLCLSLFVGPGRSELNLFEGGVGHPSVVKQ